VEWRQGECDGVFFGDELESRIQRIKQGDNTSREQLINEAKPFVARVVGRLCGRCLNWDYDDELSIGLIAFNEAIDRFNSGQGVPFTAFARLVIRSRVTDYLRRESKWNQVDFNHAEQVEGSGNQAENAVSWEQYITETINRERKEEIIAFSQKIGGLGITFGDLVDSSPKHRDTRETLLRAATYLAGHDNLYQELLASKRLPIREIARGTGISRKVLERGRKYIIAVATLLYYRDDFVYLSSYIRLPRGDKR
jgi:RNA polymerase sigma factor